MAGLVLQGFGSQGTIGQITRDGLGADATTPDPASVDIITATITPTNWQKLQWRNPELEYERQLRDREFGESIRADYRRVVLGIDPVRDEIARLEAIAAEPIPQYVPPQVSRPSIMAPAAPVMAQTVAAAGARRPSMLGKYSTALSASWKPSRFSK